MSTFSSSSGRFNRPVRSLVREMQKINRLYPSDVKMGLENTLKLYDLVGRPLERTPVVHVAGTNGKGSVCFKTAEALKRSGLKTGLFVSPHISSFRERIQIDNKLLEEAEMHAILPGRLSFISWQSIYLSPR